MLFPNSSRILLGSSIALLSLGALLGQTQQAKATGLDIQLDYRYDTNNFFSDQNRKDTLEDAVLYFESAFNDNLDAITPGGGNTWSPTFFHPGTGQQGFTDPTLTDLSIPANQILVFAGGYDIGGSTIGQGGPGGYSAGGTTQAWFDTLKSRGQAGALNQSDPSDFGPWGGSITFDTSTTWHFGDASTSIPSGQNDFLSVAIHELAHLFGFSTAPSWNTPISGNQFTGAKSVEINGSSVTLNSDGSHWVENTMSQVDGVSQEAAMDPDIIVGTRKLLTDLDYAGLEDIGWQVDSSVYSSSVPFEFSPSLGILVVAGMFGTKKVWNTRKAKEPAVK